MSRCLIRAALLEVLDEEHAEAVIEHRRVTIKKQLTAYGAKRLAAKLAEWGDANEAADIMIDRCWRGFECEWVRDRVRPKAGRRSYADAARDIALDMIDGRQENQIGSRH